MRILIYNIFKLTNRDGITLKMVMCWGKSKLTSYLFYFIILILEILIVFYKSKSHHHV